MNKKLISVLLIVMMGIMILPGCSNKDNSDNDTSTDSNKVAEAARQAYMGILEDNSEEIDKYDWQSDYDQNNMINNVAIEDINADGVPELFFMSTDRAGTYAEMHIYRYNSETETVEECDYVYNAKMSFNKSNHLQDVNVAKGTSYIVYMNKSGDGFYICSRVSDQSAFCCSAAFKMDDNGEIKTINTVYNEYCDILDYEKDLYYIDGKEVSSESAIDMLKEHREDFGKVIMYSVNNGCEDMKVFENLKGVTPCATSRTELMK